MDEKKIPPAVRQVWADLDSVSPTYLVGGAVRDLLRGEDPHDWDFATALHPEAIQAWARGKYKVIPTGAAWGTVTILHQGISLEVTTFRRDGRYSDHRHPDSVSFSDSLEEDLSRRDFRINALAYSFTGDFIDPFGGFEDLQVHRIQTVGVAADRFQEDPLRMWRAARFAAQRDWEVSPEIIEAIDRYHSLMYLVSRERIQTELWKLLGGISPRRGLDVAHQGRLLDVVWPEWGAARGFDQHNPHHDKPVDQHLLATACLGETSLLRLAGLLHDIAKPACFTQDAGGTGHFYNHEHVGAIFARDMLTRLRFPIQTAGMVSQLVDYHMFPWWDAGDKAIRRLVHEVGAEQVQNLIALHVMDHCASRNSAGGDLSGLKEHVTSLLKDSPPPPSLAISGYDVMAWLGIPPGPRVGQVLRRCWDWVGEDPLRNTYAQLKGFVLGLGKDYTLDC